MWAGVEERERACVNKTLQGTGFKLTEGRYHAHLVGPLEVGVPELVIAHGGDEQGRQRQTGHALRDVSGIDRSPKVSSGHYYTGASRHGGSQGTHLPTPPH